MNAPSNAIALVDPEDPRILKLDDAARRAALIRPESGNPFADMLRTANCMKAIRSILTPEVMAPIMDLQNSRLGFKTDRKEGYGVGIVKDAVIEATINGVPLIGNCFNIIAEQFYLTREGITFKLNHLPGLRYQIVPGVPEMVKECGFVEDRKNGTGKPRPVPGEARIGVRVEWEKDGEKGSQTLTFSIRVNYGMAADAIVGKAFCRAAKWLYARVTGLDIGVTEGDSVENAPAAGRRVINVTPAAEESAPKPSKASERLASAFGAEAATPETTASRPGDAREAPSAPKSDEWPAGALEGA